MIKNPPASAGDTGDAGSIPGSGRSPGGGHGNPLQCSCLENPMDGAAWRATVHGVTVRHDLVTKQEGPQNSRNCPVVSPGFSVFPLLYILAQLWKGVPPI